MTRKHTSTTPGKWQNDLPQDPSGEPYRGKSDITQPSGGIEFVNTKGEESITYYYRGGSFLRFQKFSTDLFVPVSMQTHVYGSSFETVNKDKVVHVDGAYETMHMGDSFSKVGDSDKTQKHAEDWMKNMKELHNMKRRFEIKRTKVHNKLDQAEGQTKSGKLASCPTEQIVVKTLYTASAMVWKPATKTAGAHTIGDLQDNSFIYRRVKGGGGFALSNSWGCFTCGGDGLSPSTQDGQWNPDPIKDKIKDKMVELAKPLAESEKQFGSSRSPGSGNDVRTSNNNIIEHIGNVFNTMESYRKDPKGKLVPYGMKVDPHGAGVYPQFRESGLIERVHVDPTPGGQYHITACDRFSLTVGSNGINFKTSGDVNMFGIQTNILSERTVINGKTEVIIGGERVDISGDIITLRPRKISRSIEGANGSNKDLPAHGGGTTQPEQQVLVDGNLNVAKNAIVAGGMHVEGEVSLQHITAPCEYHITETDFEIEKQPTATAGTCTGETLDVVGSETECTQDVIKDTTHADLLAGHYIGYNETFVTDPQTCPCCGALQAGHVVPCGRVKIVSTLAPNSIMVHPHYHWFKNLPLKLIRDNTTVDMTIGGTSESKKIDPHSAVRAVGSRNNFAEKNMPMPVENSKTNNTVIEKFETCE